MIVYSHRRSGTHLLIEHIKRCFDIEAVKWHELTWEQIRNNQVVGIIRDGRDVLTSCYHWWRESGESEVCGIKRSFEGVTFARYLNGIKTPHFEPHPPGNVSESEIKKGLLDRPITYWVNHTHNAFYKLPIICVYYEDLVLDPEKPMHTISKYLNIPIKEKPKPIEEPVGYYPRKGKIGDHRNYFGPLEQYLFDQKARPLMEQLGYY